MRSQKDRSVAPVPYTMFELSISDDEDDKKELKLMPQQNNKEYDPNEMHELSKNVSDIKEIAISIHDLLLIQGETIDRIEDNVDVAINHIEVANKDIEFIKLGGKHPKAKMGVSTLIGTGVGAVLGGPVGAIVLGGVGSAIGYMWAK